MQRGKLVLVVPNSYEKIEFETWHLVTSRLSSLIWPELHEKQQKKTKTKDKWNRI